MAKYTVDHVCGHSEVVSLVGKHADRERKLAWMAGQDCLECRIEATRKATAEKAAQIRANALDAEWPKLTGTDRQIDWATTIRLGLLRDAQEFAIQAEAEVAAAESGDPERFARISGELHGIGLAVDYLRNQANAGWWIDNRSQSRSSLIKSALESIRVEEARKAEAAKLAEVEVRKRALAARARELFGSDEPDFRVQVWSKDPEKRVYIGHGYDANWVEYFHTGNGRVAPGTLKVIPEAVDPLAAHLGTSAEDAKARIKEYCAGLCRDWKAITIEVSEANAPTDPAAAVTRYALKATGQNSGVRYAKNTRSGYWCYDASDADNFASPEAALAAAPNYCGDQACYLCKSADLVEVVPVTKRLPFPPKGN